MQTAEKYMNCDLSSFQRTTLKDLNKSDLMERVDIKFLFPASLLPQLLDSMVEDFFLLAVDGVPVNSYDTVYFDTPENRMFLEHHNGNFPRYKIRRRRYGATNSIYLEVKRKDNKGTTKKRRIASADLDGVLTDSEKSFISDRSPFDPEKLKPSLSSSYKRVTLLSASGLEKCTFDSMLRFDNSSKQSGFEELIICEFKSKSGKWNSPFLRKLKELGIRPLRFSKYCTGMLLKTPGLKYNNFKRRVMKVNSIKQVAATGDIKNN